MDLVRLVAVFGEPLPVDDAVALLDGASAEGWPKPLTTRSKRPPE
jgi:hypothetical protein